MNKLWHWIVALLHTSVTTTVTVPTPYHLQKKKRTGYKKLKGSRPWTTSDDIILRAYIEQCIPIYEIALVLDRTPTAVRIHATKLGIDIKGHK